MKMKIIHINTLILAARSPFFYKLFSNGMAESNQQHVTLRIQESEEGAFMDLLKFMYTNMISRTTTSALLDVLVAADKYEVASCMKYCFQLLQKLPMSYESALLFLDLPSSILTGDIIRPLADAAKGFLVAHFKDMSKFQEEMLNLPLPGIESVLSSNDLQVCSEDEIYDFVMKWARRHHTNPDKRREILSTCLLRLIRFPFMSHRKLREVQTCTDIDIEHRSKLVFDAISHETPHRQQERAYKLRPVKVIHFDSPHEGCVVYLNLKHANCPIFLSQDFYLGGHALRLMGLHRVTGLRLLLFKQAEGSLGVECQISSRKKLNEEFTYERVECQISSRKKRNEEFARDGSLHMNVTGASNLGYSNLFDVHFINGVLHLRLELKIKKLKGSN